MLERRLELTECVATVDDRGHSAGLHKVAQDGEVIRSYFRQDHAELLVHERRQKECLDRGHHRPEPIAFSASDDNENAVRLKGSPVR